MRKHNYLIGHKGESQCVFGKALGSKLQAKNTELLTLAEAKRAVNKWYCCGPKMVIFKLVKVGIS